MKEGLKTIAIRPSFFEENERTAVAWLGMAGALINARGKILLIDPLITQVEKDGKLYSEVGYGLKVPFPIQAQEIHRADYVMYTHADDDHFGRATAETLGRLIDCQFLAPPPIVKMLTESGIHPSRISQTRDFLRVQAGSVEVMVTPALHDWQEVNPWRREDCCGFLVKSPDGSIWHPGDTKLIDELFSVKDVDVLFFDVADVEAHLGPKGSAQLARSSGAKAMIAYHYGTFDLPAGSFGGCDPEDALPYLEGISAKYLRLNPGEVLYLPMT